MHKNIKLWWKWDVGNLRAPDGLAFELRMFICSRTHCAHSHFCPMALCLGPFHGSRWWVLRWEVMFSFSPSAASHAQTVWALPLTFSSINSCHLWCSGARVEAEICLCGKCCICTKRFLQQSGSHGRKQWDTAYTHLARTRGGETWMVKTNIHAPKIPLGRAGRNGLDKCWCVMFVLLSWKMSAHQFGLELMREKFGCWGEWESPPETLCMNCLSRWRAGLKWYLGGEEEKYKILVTSQN